jgi:hypothetical protein
MLWNIHIIWGQHNKVLGTINARSVLKVIKNSVVPFLTGHLCHTATTTTAAFAIRSATDSKETLVATTAREGYTAIARAAWSWTHRCSRSDWLRINVYVYIYIYGTCMLWKKLFAICIYMYVCMYVCIYMYKTNVKKCHFLTSALPVVVTDFANSYSGPVRISTR